MKNLQGDIIGILDNNLAQVVSYTYDSWGKLISIKDANGNEITDTTNIGLINPYRYRSYRYDTETGLYYLNSRYYNLEWGRFINADGTTLDTGADLLGHNIYAYCANNPINNVDPTGESISLIAGLLVAAIGTIAVSTLPEETYVEAGQIAGEAVSGVVDSAKGAISYLKNKISPNKVGTNSRKITELDVRMINSQLYGKPNIAVFPVNPYDFNPRGCIRTVFSGSKNGRIIEWRLNNQLIFRWDEDLKWGSHYHVLPNGSSYNIHYRPLTLVPYPFNQIFF